MDSAILSWEILTKHGNEFEVIESREQKDGEGYILELALDI